ncbi:MAG: DUF4173 domain-containing protein [Lachnospiraceae bacterium]|nr:DUF4173 domain-containing protein [Lachnospiraceae bacterium]
MDSANVKNDTNEAAIQNAAETRTNAGSAAAGINANAAPAQAVQKSHVDTGEMVARCRRVLPKALIFAISAVLLLYRNRTSAMYPVFMGISLGLLARDCKEAGRSLIRSAAGKPDIKLFYCVVLMLLSITKCVIISPDISWGSGLGILLIWTCLLLKVYADREGQEVTEQLAYMVQMLLVPLKHLELPFHDISVTRRSTAGEMSPGKKRARSILIGLLIAIPLIVVILALLSSADMIFGDLVQRILDCIELPELGADYFGVPFKLCVSFLAFYCWAGALGKESFRAPKEGKRFDAVIAITFNSIIAVIYLIFSGIQFVYLVGRMELPGGYTYAEYAHEGFYQLLAVTILNLMLVSFCKKHFGENIALKVILTIISLCTYVMIASSALRMFLYVGVYGLSHLRVYVLWLLVVLVVWTTLLTVGIYRQGIPFFRIITVFVSVWYLAFAFSVPDRWIAAYDLQLEVPPVDLAYEVYADATEVILEDGRYWADFRENNSYDVGRYRKRNALQRVRKFNFAEEAAMKLMIDN